MKDKLISILCIVTKIYNITSNKNTTNIIDLFS